MEMEKEKGERGKRANYVVRLQFARRVHAKQVHGGSGLFSEDCVLALVSFCRFSFFPFLLLFLGAGPRVRPRDAGLAFRACESGAGGRAGFEDYLDVLCL